MTPRTERFETRMDPQLLARIDHWSQEQPDSPSRSEAVRRLIEAGLEQSSRTLTPNAAERLTLWMLAELLKKSESDAGEHSAELILEAIYGGHFWALEWELTGVLHGQSDKRKDVRDVVNVLDMWNFIERAFENLSDKGKARVLEALPYSKNGPEFSGFDGNDETEQMSIALFLINVMGRFERFKGRSMNAHAPTIRRNLRMFQIFDTIRPRLSRRELNEDELIHLLRWD